jgi:hypothetical protein
MGVNVVPARGPAVRVPPRNARLHDPAIWFEGGFRDRSCRKRVASGAAFVILHVIVFLF